jgi:hypothetical protein
MKIIHVVSCVLLSMMAGPLFGQSIYKDHQVFELPSLAPVDGKADHVVSAINDRGDIFLAWSSSVYPISHAYGEMRRVEGAYLRRVNDFRWRLYPTVTLGETQPSNLPGGVSIFPNGDNCRKPDVVATGNDFIVAWQRLELGDTSNGYLECARIQVSSNGDPVVNLANSVGLGFILDQSVDLRRAGGMVDLAYDRGSGSNNVIAVYVSRTGATPTTFGVAYDFELRGVSFGFNGNQTAPLIKQVQVLNDHIAMDDFQRGGDPAGGRVLPDAVFDPFGNLVVAFEDFRLAVRGAGVDQGKIGLQRFQVKANGRFTLLNDQSLVGSHSEWAMRRPNMIRNAGSNSIDLVFGERLIPTVSTDAYHYSVDYPDATSDAILTDQLVTNTPGVDEDQPIPVQIGAFRAIMICADPNPGKRRVSTQRPNQTDWTDLDEFLDLKPWRPTMDVLTNDPNRPGDSLVVLAVEGRESSMPYTRIYCEIITP